MTPDSQTVGRTCDARAAADLLRALAHPMRLTILCRLVDGELPVSGFESELGLKQPSLSQQLGLLREAGLVTTRREAKSVVYDLADHRLLIVLDALRSFIADQPAAPPNQVASIEAPRGASANPSRKDPAVQGDAPARRAPSATEECGVFAVAGWPASGSSGTRRG